MFFLTGTDEHGVKMVRTAEKLGVEPGQLAEQYMARFKGAFEQIGITNDDFIRTTEPRHESAVQEIVRRMLAKGDIYEGSYSGWYDEGEERFVTENEAKTQDYKSDVSGRPLVRHEEKSYFFRLTKYLPRLVEHLEQNPGFVRPEARRNKVLAELKKDVGDLSISRASLSWGVPMPSDPSHVVYVWIDALSNYVTALGYATGDEKFGRYWPAARHLIGKEILWFHAVYWPCMLMSLDLPLPREVFAHGWWTVNQAKMSKSLGNFISLDDLFGYADQYHFDAVRYYMLRAAPFGNDLEWSDVEFHRSYEELQKVLGNLLNRVIKMVGRYRGGVLPAAGELDEGDRELLAEADALPARLAEAYGGFALQDAAMLPIELARRTNAYVDRTEPFKLAKDEQQAARLDTVLAVATRAVQAALIGLLPALPEKAAAGLAQLRAGSEPIAAGHELGEGEPLFPRVEAEAPEGAAG